MIRAYEVIKQSFKQRFLSERVNHECKHAYGKYICLFFFGISNWRQETIAIIIKSCINLQDKEIFVEPSGDKPLNLVCGLKNVFTSRTEGFQSAHASQVKENENS